MIKNWCKDMRILLKSLYLVFGRHYRNFVSIKIVILYMLYCIYAVLRYSLGVFPVLALKNLTKC